MKNRVVGLGLIGCGAMCRIVTKKLLAGRPRIKVRAVCDPNKESIKKTLAEFNSRAVVYKDYRCLVEDPGVDWVMIASWNCFHKEQVIASFKAGKDVFCQKPLATTLRDCIAMRRAWKKSGKMFNIGFTLRYSPHYRKIQQLIEQGRIGRIISLEFNETLDFNHGGYIMGDWRRFTRYAGTHLLEKCCHDIDLANWIVGSKAVRVASFGGLNFFTPRHEYHIKRVGRDRNGACAYRTWPGKVNKNPFTSRKDIVDNQVAIIEYANGVRAAFHTNCNAGIRERRMYICGTEGAIRADVIRGTIELRRIGFQTKIKRLDKGVKGGHGGGDEILAEELARSMLNGQPPVTGLDDGLISAVTCFAIDEAMKTGRVVDVRPYYKKEG